MPKALHTETCRFDTKKGCVPSTSSKKSSPLSTVVATTCTKAAVAALSDKTTVAITNNASTSATTSRKKLSSSFAKTKVAKTSLSGNETKLKGCSRKNATVVCVKTRSGVGVPVKDASNARTPSESRSLSLSLPSKMKDKAKLVQQVSLPSPKDVSKLKFKELSATKRSCVKNVAKKAKSVPTKCGAAAGVKNEPVASTSTMVPPKKDPKKRKEQPLLVDTISTVVDGKDHVKKAATKGMKKVTNDSVIDMRKECPKAASLDESIKKESKTVDERCMAPKKRIKHKCVVDGLEVKKEPLRDEKQLIESQMPELGVTGSLNNSTTSPVRNVKFFKSKNKKGDKSKDVNTPLSTVKTNNEAFSVYDNLDEDSEESTNKTTKNKKPSKQKIEKVGSVNKMKQHLEEFKKTKPVKDGTKAKKLEDRNEKRKRESGSEAELGVQMKKMKRVTIVEGDCNKLHVSDDDASTVSKNVAKLPRKLRKKPIVSKMDEDSGTASSSSDNAPLNRLIANKRMKVESVAPKASKASLKREALSDESDVNLKPKKTNCKNPSQKTKLSKSSAVENAQPKTLSKSKKEDMKLSKPPPKKSVKFTKEVTSKPCAKPMPQRSQRMASLNAMAMVHCMYENESKNVSVSSFDSAENSDDNSESATLSSATNSRTSSVLSTTVASAKSSSALPKKSVSCPADSDYHQPEVNEKELNKTRAAALVKFEPHFDKPVDSVISRESLRMAPGLRSVGKHWDMNGSSISSTLSDDNEALTMAAAAAAAAVVASAQPLVMKDCSEKPRLEKSLSSSLSKKKFARALRRPLSDDSSEEEKHQAILLKEKQRMMRRRRRQRSKEITMDLKDMVVCKRMASLNATAILAASYSSSSSTTGRRTVMVKSSSASTSAATSGAGTGGGCGSSRKSDEKSLRENVDNFEEKTTTDSLINKMKGDRRKLPFIRKKFCSSSDADVEDEADLSGSEVVLKTASTSGKQQVSLIVNQDSGVTITGLYLNSTTKSTHHQGYCSISGMQYRISSTSHTQTEATTVTSEAVVRAPQEPLRPSMTASTRQQDAVQGAAHPSPVKTYTPLGALSSMQPPGSPHHLHHHHHHPKTVAIASATQELSSLERHGCPSAFSAPTVYGPPPPPPPTLATVAARPAYPLLPKTPPEPAFVAGYYQPAGPLISHHHHHHHHHHHVQSNSEVTTSAVGLSTATATSASPSASTISFTKVSQSPLVQPPTPPASNVTQPVLSELSDSEMASATTPAAEITVSESTPPEETNYPLNYRFGASSTSSGTAGGATITNNAPPFRSPSHNYQSYYPSPPSTASLSHQQHQQSQPLPHHQHQQTHFQEVLYSPNPQNAPLPPPPSNAYHHGYLPVKGPPYAPPSTLQRRYIPALPPQQQYFHHEYPSSLPGNAASQHQVVVPTHPLAAAAAAAAAAASDSYHSAPPTPSIIESYPPPLPPPPPSLYYSGYSSAPPTPYYPYATSSRSLTLVETSCPCPLQGCQKNVDTGPLTGFISKGPVEQRNTPLSPVALSLPKEPHDIRSLPSPARGSAGARPTPSPAIATAKNPSLWNETCCDYGCNMAGLLAISKAGPGEGDAAHGATTAVDSAADLDSGIDGSIGDTLVDVKAKRRSIRREHKKMKLRRFKMTNGANRDANRMMCCAATTMDDQCVGKVCPVLRSRTAGSAETTAVIAAACVSRTQTNSSTSAVELCDSTDASYISPEPSIDEAPVIKCQKNCKRWLPHSDGENDDDDNDDNEENDSSSDLDMPPKLYPEVDIEYQNRLRRCASGAVTAGVAEDGEPPTKKSKTLFSAAVAAEAVQLLDDDVVDVEKSNYLSALQLRSVSDSAQSEPSTPVVMSASALVESLAPLNGYGGDERLKVNVAEKTTRVGDGAANAAVAAAAATATAKNAPTNEAAQLRSVVDSCAPCCAARNGCAAAKCRTWNAETRKPRFRRRRWTTKKRNRKKKPTKWSKGNEEEKLEAENAERRRRAELLSLSQTRAASRLKWSNGWTWLGEPFVSKVFMNTEGPEVLRTCYHAMQHRSGDIIRPKDCILLRSGCKKTDLPYVAKVAHLWEDPEDGEMMISLFWYYRPEHTEHDASSSESPFELFASKHKDVNSVACIEDKCYVLTFNEYCRYHKSIRQTEESVDISSVIVPPLGKKRYPRQALLPPENTWLDLVYFCRKIYDFRQHRLLKNPFFV